MLDFPASPTTGQTFAAPNGTAWKWDGVKWASTSAGTGFLPLTGGALTGDLSIASPDANNLTLTASGTNWPGARFNLATGQGAWIGSYMNGKERWEIDLGNAIAEGGSNAGSNFQIARYADNGNFIDDPLIILRSTGLATVNGDPTAALGIATKQYVDAQNIRYRNRIINGDMSVDQRHGGAAVAITGPISIYAIDRWQYEGQGIGSVGQTSGPPGVAATGGLYSLGWTTTTAHAPVAADYSGFWYPIEGYNFNDANWGTATALPVTLEFWVYASQTGTFAGALQNFAENRSYVFTYTVSTVNTWQKFRIAIPGDTAGTWNVANTAGVAWLFFNLGAGSTYVHAAGAWVAGNFVTASGVVNPVATLNASIYIARVALMVGAAAANAEPEFKSFAENLRDCMRYYQRNRFREPGFLNNPNASCIFNHQPSVLYRGTPAVSLTNSSVQFENIPYSAAWTYTGCTVDGSHMNYTGGDYMITGTGSGTPPAAFTPAAITSQVVAFDADF